MELYIFFLILLSFTTYLSSANISLDESVHQVQVSGSDCFLDLAKNQFELHSTLSIVKSKSQYATTFSLGISTEDLILQNLIKTCSWSMMVKCIGAGAKPQVEYGFEKVHNYVIVFQSASDLNNALQELSVGVSWNPHAIFLTYFLGFPEDLDRVMSEVVEVFWRYWVVNMMIVVPSQEISGHLLITYFPFHEDCGKKKVTYVTVGQCVNSSITPAGLNGFPSTIPDYLSHCPVKVGAINSPPFVIASAIANNSSEWFAAGIEVALINTIAEMANFKVEIVLLNKTSSNDLLDELEDRQIDIAIGTISPTVKDHRKFDFSFQYRQDVTTWVLPSDLMLPHWMGLLLVFQPTVFGVAFLLLLFLWFASSRIVKLCTYTFRNEHGCYRDSGTLLLVTMGMLLANEPSRFPRTRFLKCMLLMWTLFSFYWNSAFSASLTSVMTNKVFLGGIRTEQHIVEQQLKMMVTNRTRRYISRLTDSNVSLEACFVIDKCLLEMSGNRDSALAINRKYFDLVKRQFVDENGNYQLKTLKTNIVTVPIEMVLSQGNPLLSRINNILLKIIESGLIEHWTRMKTALQTDEEQKADTILTLNHLKGGFYLWLLGIGLSILMFTGEVLYFRWQRIEV